MAIPENRKIPASTQIKGIEAIIDGRVLPANPDQIINTGDGFATLASVYKIATGTVTFNTNKVQGSSTSPQYNFLTVSNTNPRDLNNVVVKHSSLVVPAVLVPNKPSSPLTVYVDQATMLADQVNQVSGSYYAYTGSTSMWLYNGVANGLITDYTEVVEVTGWEEWGAKPAWLIVQGDAYLVGENNINTLSFVFYELIKIGGVSYHDVVVCTVTAHTAMNRDAEKNSINSLIINLFSGTNPPQADSINNESTYADLFEANLSNPETASFIDLGGGNSAIEVGVNTNTLSSRADITYDLTERGQELISNNEFTIICRTNFLTLLTIQNRCIMVNRTADIGSDSSGFSFSINESTGRLELNYYDVGGVTRSLGSSLNLPVVPVENGQWVIAIRFWVEGGLTRARFYFKSTANSYVFQELGEERTRADVPKLGHSKINLTKLSDTTGTSRPERRSYFQYINRLISESELEAKINAID